MVELEKFECGLNGLIKSRSSLDFWLSFSGVGVSLMI